MERLETIAPELVQRLKHASPIEQREAARVATEFALHMVNIRHACIEEARNCLRLGNNLSSRQHSELEALASNLDDEYFDLQKAVDEGGATTGEYVQKFAQARVVSALLFAFKNDAFEASTEAIYEATVAFDDKRPLFTVVESVLSDIARSSE